MKDLIDLVLEQMQEDIGVGDFTAIEELIRQIPKAKLIAYLPEDTVNNYKQVNRS
jgi:hypothetical protein